MDISANDLIFIVDDDTFMQSMVSNHLKARGLTNIKKFSTGEDCIAALALQPRLVILDQNLSTQPGALNGFDIFKLIRQTNPKTIIVMMSGQEDGQLVLQMMKQGIRHYVIKDSDMLPELENVMSEF
ncbi:MAG: response regulator [Bacteroidota bacterium]